MTTSRLHRQHRPWVAAMLMPLVLVGCASTVQQKLVAGETSANRQLLVDTRKEIASILSHKGCKEIQSITAAILDPLEGPRGYQRSTERWEVMACDQQYAYLVTYQGDGGSSTYVSVSPERSRSVIR